MNGVINKNKQTVRKKPEKRRKSITTWKYVFAATLMMLVNILLGLFLSEKSGEAMKTLISARMLDITNTAADMIDGDILKNITPEDAGTPEYEEIMEVLTHFQDNIELKYIYCIQDKGNKNFVFGIDPTPVDPGEFGAPVVFTEALFSASRGKAAADMVSYSDEWGSFYSAYSPVFDSEGNVAGIIAVDFDKTWYDSYVNRFLWTTVLIVTVSLAVGVALVIMFTSNTRKRISRVNSQLGGLADNFTRLMTEVRNMSGSGDDPSVFETEDNYTAQDDIEAIQHRIIILQDELYSLLASVRHQAFTDSMTGVRNKSAYIEREREISLRIKKGSAAFTVVIFDVNGLKKVNDSLGHAYGDMLLKDAADILIAVYGSDRVYRVGGDEFIAIINSLSEDEIQTSISRFDYHIAAENAKEKPYGQTFAVSRGYAIFRPGIDSDYQDVFRRADHMMYQDKAAYYRTHGDRRRRQEGS